MYRKSPSGALERYNCKKSTEKPKKTEFRWSSTAMCEEEIMNMSEVITRINVLAKKAKTEGLTAEEISERDRLRRIYIDSVKANLVGQLENTYIVGPDGTKKKLERK